MTTLANGRTFRPRPRARDGVIRGARLALPAGVAARYAARLVALVREMTKTVEREITDLFKHPDVQDYLANFHVAHVTDAAENPFKPTVEFWDGKFVVLAPLGWPAWAFDAISPASQSRILTNKLKERFEQLFGMTAKDDATKMVGEADAASAANVSRSLREISEDYKLSPSVLVDGEFAKAVIAQNVSLIKSIPEEYLTDVQGAVLRSITDGRGLDDLTKYFAKQEGITERRAYNIATDQTHKAYNGFNRARMTGAGIRKFEWVHSGGGLHPRILHMDVLDGQIYAFDKLPVIDDRTGERGIPGQAVNCRCTMVPVIATGDDQ